MGLRYFFTRVSAGTMDRNLVLTAATAKCLSSNPRTIVNIVIREGVSKQAHPLLLAMDLKSP